MTETSLKTFSEEFGDLVIDCDAFGQLTEINGLVYHKEGDSNYIRSKVLIPADQALIVTKINNDIAIDHPCVPKIVNIQIFPKYIFEYRRIDCDFSIFEPKVIKSTKESRKYRMIAQIIDFINYMSLNNMIYTLHSLDDLSRVSLIDSSDNLLFFDTSFIEINADKAETSHQNIISCGEIIFEIIGGEIKERNSNFYNGFPTEWISFIEACIGSTKIDISDSYSRFMPKVLKKSPIYEIFDAYSIHTSDFITLRSLIENTEIDLLLKRFIIKSLIMITNDIIAIIINNKEAGKYQISSEGFTTDSIVIGKRNKVHFIGTLSWLEDNKQQDKPFNIQYQLLFRLGHLIHQIMSNKVTSSVPDWFEDSPSQIDDSLPFYAKASLFYCWFWSEYFQNHFYQEDQIDTCLKFMIRRYKKNKIVKIDLLIQQVEIEFERGYRCMSLSDYFMFYPFANPSFDSRRNMIISILFEIIQTYMIKKMEFNFIKSDSIIVDSDFNFIRIDYCSFSLHPVEIKDNDEEEEKNENNLIQFPEEDVGKMMKLIFDNKENSDKIEKSVTRYVRKLAKLCFPKHRYFHIPLNSLYNSIIKRRISKRQSLILHSMKHIVEIEDLKNYHSIGKGASSIVFKLDNEKVIKILHDLNISNCNFLFFENELFYRELQNLIFINSCNIFKVYGLCIEKKNNSIGFVMEYLPRSLEKSLTKDQALDYSIKISECMEKLHEHCMIHRDLKPGNIRFKNEGEIVIIDFGLSIFSKGVEIDQYGGTPIFLAPEAILGDEYTYKVDVYAFAITILLIFGAKNDAFDFKNQYSFFRKIIDGWRPDIPPDVPKCVARLMRMCWDGDPDKRPTFHEITSYLKSAMSDAELLEAKYELIDWSKKNGICYRDGQSFEYKILGYDIKNRQSIKSSLDRMLMSGNPHVSRLEDYIFGEESICLIYGNEEMIPLSEFVAKNDNYTRCEILAGNIEYLVSTFDMLHSNGLIVASMNSKTIKVSSHWCLCLCEISVPGIVSEERLDGFDFIDSPEQRANHEATVSSNVYSFGAMIAFIINSWEPFLEDGSIDIKKVKKKYQSLVRSCVQSDPSKRPNFQQIYKILFPTKYQSYSQCIDLMNTRLSIFQTIQFKVDDLKPIREIGQGQFSHVYLAENKRTGSVIAVKECNKKFKREILSPIYQELAALNVLKHPNLIRILGTNTSPMKGVSIMMEYADGGDLSSLIKSKSLSVHKFAKLLVDISCGMNFMHVRNVIHRDLKPANVLISHRRALVSDFNSAAFVSDRGMPLVFGNHGTKCFTSPEMMNSLPCSFSTDVFSFGMIVCCFFTENIRSLWNQILNNEDVDLSFINDENMRNLAKRCLEFDWSRRPTFDFIGRFLIKKFKLKKYKTELLYPSRHDLSQIEGMRNQLLSGNRQVAGDYGRHLLLEGKIKEAKQVFEEGREDGSCMNNYAMLLYLEGKRRESVDYFSKAAKLGDVFALMVLGIRCECPELFDEEADESPSRFKRALDFYRRSAFTKDRLSHIENPKAKYLEGLLYESNQIEGISEEDSFQLSIKCFKEAALEFDSDGLNKVGLMIESGLIDEAYKNEAEINFRMSASQMNPSGMKNMSRILRSKDLAESEFYDGLSHLFGGSDIPDFRTASDVIGESWELHGQLSELTRGFEVGSEMYDPPSLSNLHSHIVSGRGIHQNVNCSKHMYDELSFANK